MAARAMWKADLALGETAEARKLLTVTRLLHPHLGGGESKAAYDALQLQIDQSESRRSLPQSIKP